MSEIIELKATPEEREQERPLSPKEIVAELDKYIVGQYEAKRAVAIALRNRVRRMRVTDPIRREILPKNILMIGPTGVGKTEIARRLAHLVRAPFLKVEATKYTEVGYVGRDVDSMIRDLVEVSVHMVRQEAIEKVRREAEHLAEERILDALAGSAPPAGADPERRESWQRTRERLREKLRAGELEDRYIELRVKRESPFSQVNVFSLEGTEQLGIDLGELLEKLNPMGFGYVTKRLPIKEAREVLFNQEADTLINHEEIRRQGLRRAEESGIIFIDEIDKIAAGGREERFGPGVSRQGVQRDLLPILEGSTVRTRYGNVRTDNILFIAAGAFTMAKPSDLIPELQGRLPIRVELHPLSKADFKRILTEPEDALTKQYQALMAVEGLRLEFSEDALEEIAEIAYRLNERLENIGARRLQTVMEKLMEDIAFETCDLPEPKSFVIDAAYVKKRLHGIVEDLDLSRYIL
ncbi:MAG: ATP-dependent protease ATPase subunit HslU [Candidatus Bipolaricaulota bacterium]|nr:ATP-dependent protease ATPase subunit HslU [Candidatus Bipolaricaulota bacterium]MCS7274797.1 ATP-dependent protease ATPase subunit HslU [Candidatus Bipolaricaulota bacterium]MDW8110068.1 ATP-dependent protease ATPase subunit HslU [Candidatus Bipolaricaulota bacterium]MDW8329603.1 ATP-dependent protease ATPase subunit HslU [Candidatus Bipolaricaulota bacterium]